MADSWQPIETAPPMAIGERAHEVLLWGRSIGIRTGRAGRFPDGDVFASVNNINGNIAITDATHWMLLPDPPSSGLDRGRGL